MLKAQIARTRRTISRRPQGKRIPSITISALVVLAAGCSSSTASPSVSRPRQAPVSTPTRPAVPSTTTTACSNDTAIASWTLEQRVAQLVVIPVDETQIATVAPTINAGAGGIILFGNESPKTLGSDLRHVEAGAPHGVSPFVMSDEEGGEVQRLAGLIGAIPWPATMAKTYSVTQVRALAQQAASKMVANGVTMDLAPVLDLASGPGPDSIHTDGPRSFSPSATVATSYGIAFAQGLQDGGVIPVVKHFPGEGSASANTDSSPASTPPISALEQADLLPFTAAIRAGLPAVMVGNAAVPGLTTRPAALSAAVTTDLLRRQLGFQGLIITDSLSAGAVSALGLSIPAASVQALQAGADMVLFTSVTPNTTSAHVVSAIVDAVHAGTLTEAQINASVSRVLALKKTNLCH